MRIEEHAADLIKSMVPSARVELFDDGCAHLFSARSNPNRDETLLLQSDPPVFAFCPDLCPGSAPSPGRGFATAGRRPDDAERGRGQPGRGSLPKRQTAASRQRALFLRRAASN